MARKAARGTRVTVAELLVRSAMEHDRYRRDALVLPRARHRRKPLSQARFRVLSVLAGALALTGGVAAALTMPAARSTGASGAAPPMTELVPFPAAVSDQAPKSTVRPGDVGGIAPMAQTVTRKPNAVASPGHRGKPAKAGKHTGKAKGKPALVRHEIRNVPLWSRGHHHGHQHHGHHCR